MAQKKQVRSFDLFDTLIGRLHYFPQSSFDLIERQFPFPGFSFYRQAAQGKSDQTLPDIYRHFQQITDISKAKAKTLMEFEFQTDLNQIFPIEENLGLVQDGDLIITDTFYNRAQIQKILKKIGLKKKVILYVSTMGKYSGTIWDEIKNKHSISCHLGDSLHSDCKMAILRSIASYHYTNGGLNLVEGALHQIGQIPLACLMRALRLHNPYPADEPEYLLWNQQVELNVPLLIQSSLFLHQFCQKEKKKRILFTSRDGCLWIKIFQKLFPQYESIYFHSSRYTYLFPTKSYIDYVREVYTDGSVIVDVDGAGRSCDLFFKKHLKKKPIYLAIVNYGTQHHAILRKEKPHPAVEYINYDLVGALYDVQGEKPLRCKPEYDLKYVSPSHACIAKCLELLPHYHFDTFESQIVDWAVTKMQDSLALNRYVNHATQHIHLFDEKKELRHFQLQNNCFFESG